MKKEGTNYGLLIIFGSGETSQAGRAIHRTILSQVKRKQIVSILETPAGFQPNSYLVAKDIARMYQGSLGEFVDRVYIISARKRQSAYSTNDMHILEPISRSSYIFLGPGSPTYTIRQLKNSKAWELIIDSWKNGAHICLSSAASIACGKYSLPVYEIYKVGSDLYWEMGLDIFKEFKLPITIITHWNNSEGGKDLDTRFCFMGEERFELLRKMLSSDDYILGIDENTAIVFDFKKNFFYVLGLGNAYLIKGLKEVIFKNGNFYSLESIRQFKDISIAKRQLKKRGRINRSSQGIPISRFPEAVKKLINEREMARVNSDFALSDKLRYKINRLGYKVADTASRGQVINKK